MKDDKNFDDKINNIKKSDPTKLLMNDPMLSGIAKIIPKLIDSMPEPEKCDICKKTRLEKILDKVYIENIGLIKFCENCKYKSIVYYVRQIEKVEYKENAV